MPSNARCASNDAGKRTRFASPLALSSSGYGEEVLSPAAAAIANALFDATDVRYANTR
jgi:CO/xanthine dehydrogenase Mo-binding subunit